MVLTARLFRKTRISPNQDPLTPSLVPFGDRPESCAGSSCQACRPRSWAAAPDSQLQSRSKANPARIARVFHDARTVVPIVMTVSPKGGRAPLTRSVSEGCRKLLAAPRQRPRSRFGLVFGMSHAVVKDRRLPNSRPGRRREGHRHQPLSWRLGFQTRETGVLPVKGPVSRSLVQVVGTGDHCWVPLVVLDQWFWRADRRPPVLGRGRLPAYTKTAMSGQPKTLKRFHEPCSSKE